MFKKTTVKDFVEITLLLGEDEPHLKNIIYFRHQKELNVRG